MSRTSRSHRSSHRHDDTRGEDHPPRWIYLATLFVLALLLFAPEKSEAATIHPIKSCRVFNLTPHKAIECYWPRSSRATAHRIAECESTASASEAYARLHGKGRWARNGQYIGIFQMGTRERRAHGPYSLGSPSRVQVKSAKALFKKRGWQPWLASHGCAGIR